MLGRGGGVVRGHQPPDGLGEACVEVGGRKERLLELPGQGPAVLGVLSTGLACGRRMAR